MAAKKAEAAETYYLDRFGHRHEISEQDVAEEPLPALPAAE